MGGRGASGGGGGGGATAVAPPQSPQERVRQLAREIEETGEQELTRERTRIFKQGIREELERRQQEGQRKQPPGEKTKTYEERTLDIISAMSESDAKRSGKHDEFLRKIEEARQVARNLPDSSAWKHPSGKSMALGALETFTAYPARTTLIVAREKNSNEFRGVTAYSTYDQNNIYVNYLSGTGKGAGEEILQRVARDNPGKGIKLTPLSTAVTFYRDCHMTNRGGYMTFTPEEATQFAKYGKKWTDKRKTPAR